MALSKDQVLDLPAVREALARGFVEITGARASYHLNKDNDYDWQDPEEWVRMAVLASLIVDKGYPPQRIQVEVAAPRRVPGDFADIVVFRDATISSEGDASSSRASIETPWKNSGSWAWV